MARTQSRTASKRGTTKGALGRRAREKSSHKRAAASPTRRVVTGKLKDRPKSVFSLTRAERESAPETPTGRPSGYHPLFAQRAFKLTLLGMTIDEIASHFDVSSRTIARWVATQPDFRQAIKDGGPAADAEVVNALRQRAIGYQHVEEKVFCTKDGDIVTYDTIKQYPPSEVAAMMWLSNRQKTLWKNQQSMDHTNSDGSFGAFANAARQVSTQVTPGRTLEHQPADEAEIVEPSDEPASPLRE